MGMKVVFLDIDGVLVNRASLIKASGLKATADPQCVAALNKITDTTGAAIVVSSTWRLLGLDAIRAKLNEWGVKAAVLDITGDLYTSRGVEIVDWMCRWKSAGNEIDDFVILDDDADMGHLIGHLVRTRFERGLTEADAQRAIKALA